MTKPTIAVHGGAGTVRRSLMTAELEAEYRRGIEAALDAGWSVLAADGSAVDAVQAAVVALEDFPLFNAGCGSVFTHDGRNEMDASIMDGKRLKAGSVAAVKNIKNPIMLARAVMERSEHILLAGDGAMEFAAREGFGLEKDEYFFNETRWKQLEDARTSGVVQLDHTAPKPIGTVGAVACDQEGRLAAATSTGGMTNKRFGRVGDTPLIGAGTYANGTTAVSCTGHGEYFILVSAAYDVAARMEYKGLSLEAAAQETVDRITEIGGEGGLIAIDASGRVSMPFNSEGMYRGTADADGITVFIYRDRSF